MFETDRLSQLGKALILTGVITVALSYLQWKDNHHSTVSSTLDLIRERGYMKCGVASNTTGLSVIDRNSILTAKEDLSAEDESLTLFTDSVGLEADVCRSIAIGVFGTTENTVYFHIADGSWNTRMDSIVDGTIDVLIRQVAIQAELGSTHAVDFSPVVYFDRIVLLADDTEKDSTSLQGPTICAIHNSQPKISAQTYSDTHALNWNLISSYSGKAIENYGHAIDALLDHTCQAIVGRFSSLYSLSVKNTKVSTYHLLDLPETSPVPTVAVIKNSAYKFKALASHSIWTLIRAEINNQSSDKVTPEFNANYWISNNLNPDFPRRIIQQLGNYSEIYQRHFAEALSEAGPNTHYVSSSIGRLLAPR